jgi:hypothetical protein
MNILDFINSNTVRKHLQSINYKPDSLTAAFIVWQSKSHTLAEKDKAFKWIIENMPDMPIPAHDNHAARASLHEFLEEYMWTLSMYIQSFESSEPNEVYDLSAYYGAPDNEWCYDENLYSSYEKVVESVASIIAEENQECTTEAKSILFKIRRRLLDIAACSDYLYLTPNLEPYKLCMDIIMSDEDYEVLHLFENLCLPIPHPFKKGDIIRECAGKYALPTYYNDTLVLIDYMSEEEIKEKSDTLCMHDYTLYGICSDGEGETYEDSINHYLNAEIIEPGDIHVKDCVLLKESRRIKGEN